LLKGAPSRISCYGIELQEQLVSSTGYTDKPITEGGRKNKGGAPPKDRDTVQDKTLPAGTDGDGCMGQRKAAVESHRMECEQWLMIMRYGDSFLSRPGLGDEWGYAETRLEQNKSRNMVHGVWGGVHRMANQQDTSSIASNAAVVLLWCSPCWPM